MRQWSTCQDVWHEKPNVVDDDDVNKPSICLFILRRGFVYSGAFKSSRSLVYTSVFKSHLVIMKGAQNSLVYSGSFTSSCRVFSGDYKRHILISQRRSTKDCVYLNGVLNNAVDLPHMQSVVQCQLVITLDRSIFLSLYHDYLRCRIHCDTCHDR